MAISPLYIPLFNIEEVILDKDTGLPLTAGVVNFYVDAQRAQPKPVFKIAGTYPNYTFANMGAELILGISGDFVDDNGDPFVPYAYPYDADGEVERYYVTVESEGGVPQFVREAVPYIPEASIPPDERTSNQNELSNPQFVEVSFSTDTEFTVDVTGSNTVTHIAPDWDLITSGTGTVTLERLEPTDEDVPTNPPYALRIEASSGLGSTVTLRQRLDNTPSIFRGGFVSGSMTVRVISGGGSSVSMVYAPSTGSSTTIIPSTPVSTDGAYHTIENNRAIDPQVNTAASNGYIDILVTIPTARNIAITSLQIVGVSSSVNIPYDQETVARQKDHLFHYYEDSILRQSKQNLLTGWAFGQNPWQFRTTSSSNVANNDYTADQTIIIQQNYVQTGVGNNVAVGRGSLLNNYSFDVTAVTATNKFAIMQMIDAETMRPYWGSPVSMLAKVRITTSHGSEIRLKAKLMYWNEATAQPNNIAQNTPILSWVSATNKVSPASDWNDLLFQNDPEYIITESGEIQMKFENAVLPVNDVPSNHMTLAVMLYTLDNMNQTATADVIHFDKISLVQNEFAIDAAVETRDETIRRCQYYYSKTYSLSVLPGAVSSLGALAYRVFNTGVNSAGARWQYPTIMRRIPTLSYYSTTGTVDLWRNVTPPPTDSGVPNIDLQSESSVWVTNPQVGGDTINNLCAIQITADARIGKP